MKILILAPHPYYQDRRISLALRTLLEALTAEGHHPTCIVYPHGKEKYLRGCRLLRVPRLPIPGRLMPGLCWKKPIYNLRMTTMAARLLQREPFDLLVGFAGAAQMSRYLSRRFTIPYALYLDRIMGEKSLASIAVRPLSIWLEKRAIQAAAGLLLGDNELKAPLNSSSHEALVQQLEPVSHFPERPTPGGKNTTSLSDAKGAVTLMYAGSLKDDGGMELLLDAFSLACLDTPPLRLIVIGGSRSEIARYRSRARKLGVADGVHFTGWQPVDKLAGYLDQADILISPASTGSTPPPQLATFLDSGRPVIAAKAALHTRVLDDTNALLVDPVDSDMAVAIVKLAREKSLRLSLAAGAKAMVTREYSRDAYRRKLRYFFQQLRQRLSGNTAQA